MASALNIKPTGCDQLIPGFIGLNMLKKSDELCKTISLGGNYNCGSSDFMDELDRQALCTLFCCCKDHDRQNCVKNVLWQADAFHKYTGHYKAEVPFKNKLPQMSRNEPERATRGRPGGSRIPDVLVVKDGSKPPTLDNIQKVYEMKFPGDSYDDGRIGPDGKTQQRAYRDLFKKKIDENPMTAESCACDDAEKQKEYSKVLERAYRWDVERGQKLTMVPLVNGQAPAIAAAILSGGTSSTPAAVLWLGRMLAGLKFAF